MRGLEDSVLVQGAGGLWQQATTAKFLDAISDGTLPKEAFNRWLVQDYHFADGLTVFQALAVAKAPRQFRRPLVAGLNALEAELEWFEAQARVRGLDLGAPMNEVCRRYTNFLVRVAYSEPVPVLLATLFGVEASYLAAWSSLEPTGPYAEFIERWSNAGFQEYVKSLRVLTESNLHAENQRHFNEVLVHERDFWRMTREG
jgi:thiaminase/transcriptional activator TenA